MQDEHQAGTEGEGREQPFVGPAQQPAPESQAWQAAWPAQGAAASAQQAPQVPPPPSSAAVGQQAWPQYAYPYQQYQYQYQWPYAYAQRPAPKPRRSRTALIIVAVICGLVLIGGVVVVAMSMQMGGLAPMTGDTIALVRIHGLIVESMGGGPFGLGYEAGTQSIVNQIERARKDSSVKAVVIRINSPGGSAAASQEIYTAVRRLRDTKPVVVSMGDVAASGGYYVAAAADHIVANRATLTGSIGVLMQSVNIENLMQRYGVDADTVKSGTYKDTGSMWRKMTAQEREYWQKMVDDVWDQFVRDVAAGRKDKGLGVEEVKKLADGRVFTGQQAAECKLVDEVGDLRTAIEAAKKRAGIRGPAHIKELRRKSLLEEMTGPQYGSKADLMWRILQYERANPARHLLEAPVPYME